MLNNANMLSASDLTAIDIFLETKTHSYCTGKKAYFFPLFTRENLIFFLYGVIFIEMSECRCGKQGFFDGFLVFIT